LTAKCNPKLETFEYTNQKVEGCKATVDYEGPNACGEQFPIVKSFGKIAPFFGAVLIVFGGVMAFFGTKFLFYIFGSIIGILLALIIFCVCYAMFLPIDAEVPLLAGVIAVCTIIGAIGAYFSYKFTKAYTVPILGLAAGVFSFLMLAKVFGFTK